MKNKLYCVEGSPCAMVAVTQSFLYEFWPEKHVLTRRIMSIQLLALDTRRDEQYRSIWPES